MQKVRNKIGVVRVEKPKRFKVQFIKNFKGTNGGKPFRKYNVIEVVQSNLLGSYFYYTHTGLDFIPKEYVKIYKH